MKNFEEDIMTMDQYSIEDIIQTLLTKNPAHAINPLFMCESLGKWGFYVGTANNKCRIIIGNEFDNLLFRGQNKDYIFKSSYSRIISPIEKCIQWVKKEEFKDFFKSTPFYKRLPNEIGIVGRDFEFDLEALAQHYEFKTNYLDITKSLNVAMFFAYTDCVNGRYVPIINFNNTDYEPYIYVTNLGVLQSMERDNLKIVGFQVSPRPLAQKAMALDLSNAENDVTSYFAKIPLPKTEYFSVGVFNAFKKGFELIQPDILTEAVKQIKSSKNINSRLLEEYCNLNKLNMHELEQDLINNEYSIQDSIYPLSKSLYSQMNIYINEFILPFIANNIGYRKVLRPL